jgi:hypothetical protein
MAHDVDGTWDIVQSNEYKVRVTIEQPRDPDGNFADGDLSGSADEITPHGTDVSQQILTGKLIGDSFEMLVDWHNGSIGQYSGNYDPAGNLSGVTFDVNHPTAQATWLRQDL